MAERGASRPLEEATVSLRVNGRAVTVTIPVRKTLADVLRDELGLTGTHLGCEHGVCGACTILLDGAPVRSCLLFAVQFDGSEVMTVEGLAMEGTLHPLQEAFWDHHALQCGFCTPGVLMTAYALLQEQPDPSEDDIRFGLTGNLCRCTGYWNIVRAVQVAARSLRGKAES